MSDTPTDDLIRRLRGIYVIPVNDGAGPLDGKDTYTRGFQTPPIMHEAAAALEAVNAKVAALEKDAEGLRQDAELFQFCVAHCAFPHVRWNGKEGYFGLEIDGAVYCGENARLAVMNAVGALQVPGIPQQPGEQTNG